jgi:4'-phosphopantetheinyl transferase EntD
VTPLEAEAVFRSLLPDGAACAALRIAEAPGSGPLPAELQRAVESRQREFRAGRLCAAGCLAALGVEGTVGRDERAPVWPTGVAGSITHTRTLAVAAVARVSALGIDCEPYLNDDALRDVRGQAIDDAEWALLGADAALATALFSAKESLFKQRWPLTRVFLDFPDAKLVSHDARALTLQVQGGEQQRVRYTLAHGHAFTVCASPGD